LHDEIVHLVPHLGGGVGAVLTGYFEIRDRLELRDTVLCLDECRSNVKEICNLANVHDGLMRGSADQVKRLLVEANVVVIHYWNHPLLTRYLLEEGLTSGRYIFWAHNSGLSEPHIIPDYVIDSGFRILFTSGASLNAPNILDLSFEQKKRLGVVRSSRSLSKFQSRGTCRLLTRRANRLLYLGTVSLTKMHNSAPKIFAELSRLGFRIDIVGGDEEVRIRDEVIANGGTVTIHGEVEEPSDKYARSDIFIYPLRPDHYGTGEQVIAEALASGLPVVAFDNPAERELIEHGVTGFLATDVISFIEYVKLLSDNLELYKAMSNSAVNVSREKFDINLMYQGLMTEIASEARASHTASLPGRLEGFRDSGFAAFVYSSFFGNIHGESSNCAADIDVNLVFEKIEATIKESGTDRIWTSPTKSSPFHYLNYFPESDGLNELCKLIRGLCGQPRNSGSF